MLVIHPNDKTTEFLSVIYNKNKCNVLTEKSSNSVIRKSIINENNIMMLGHGCSDGLLSKEKQDSFFDRLIINSKHVDFLRNKECIGIWCNANEFAEKYKLKGLFSGMIISEMEEAIDWGIEVTHDEIDFENKLFAHRLSYCLDRFKLHDIPLEMKKLDNHETMLTLFNYSHLYYFE